MTLINIIKKSFGCVIENPSITLFLVLFLIASNLLSATILTAKSKLIALILILCFFALIFVFLSGWFKVIGETVQREKIKDKNFYAIFLEGVGEKFIPVFIGVVLYTIFAILALLIAQYIALKVFGDISFFIEEADKMQMEEHNIAQYFSSLDVNKQYAVYGWSLYIMASLLIFNFLSMFYFPAIQANKSKLLLCPFIAVWDCLKFLFKNFFSALLIGLFILLLNMAIAFLNAVFAHNPIISVILLLVYIYFISYIVMLIFNYYEEKNNSSDGSDCIGENETSNSVSEEN